MWEVFTIDFCLMDILAYGFFKKGEKETIFSIQGFTFMQSHNHQLTSPYPNSRERGFPRW